jgi:hypothetical protein
MSTAIQYILGFDKKYLTIVVYYYKMPISIVHNWHIDDIFKTHVMSCDERDEHSS